MSNPTSTITGITIQGVTTLRIDPSYAGRSFEAIGPKHGVRTVQYLYGPGRTIPGPNVPNSAYLASPTLPTPLAPGAYTLKIRYQGENDYATIDIDVVPVAQPQPPVPTQPPVVIQTPSPTPTPVPVGNTPAGLPHVEWGMCASDKDNLAVLKITMPAMKAAGGGTVRIWHSGWGTFSDVNLAIIALAESLGIKVIVCQNVKDGGSGVFGTPDIAGFVAKNRAALAKIEYIEAGNELNLQQYRPDDFGGVNNWHAAYVARWLKPLYQAIGGITKVLITSITDTWTPATYVQQYTALIAAGALNYCDGAAIHLYPTPQYAQQMFAAAAQVKALIGNKPLVMTEGGPHPGECHNDGEFQIQAKALIAGVRVPVQTLVFYRGLPNSIQSKFTLFDASGKATPALGVLVGAGK